MLSDNKEALIKQIQKIETSYIPLKEELITIEKLKDKRDELLNKITTKNISKQIKTLKTYTNYDEIMQTNNAIVSGNVVDLSLILEWNIWRAFTMLNDSEIIAN